MLKAKLISKNFDQTAALKDVSFELPNVGVVGLLGPNGAGKTTLMRILTGYLKPSRGNIEWDDKEVDPKESSYRFNIGYLPENNPLYTYMSVIEYVGFLARLKGNGKEGVRRVVEECGLTKVAAKRIETLSKGYRQRVGLAAAILGQPKLLILDEPTSGLDPNQIIEIRHLITQLAKTRLVLLSTHILTEAKEICDRLLLINQGRIVLDEATKKIKNLEKKFVELTNS